MLSKEDIKVIKVYQEHFNNAHTGYIRGVYSKDVKIMKVVYEKYGKRLSNPNCASCVLDMCKWFYNEVKKYNERYGKRRNNGQPHDRSYGQAESDMRDADTGQIESDNNKGDGGSLEPETGLDETSDNGSDINV